MPFINSSDTNSDHIIIGQNLSLNCSVSMDLGVSFKLRWKVPDEYKVKVGNILKYIYPELFIIIFNKDGHIQVSKENFFNGLKHGVGKSVGSRLLNIQNVTIEDEGNYVCEVIVHSGHKNQAIYTLKAFSKF